MGTKRRFGALLMAAGSVAGLAATAQPASALFPSLNAGRIDWFVTCSDGSGGLRATPRAAYDPAATGVYQTRIVVYRSNDTPFWHGPLRPDQAWTDTPGVSYSIPSFNHIDANNTGQFQVTAFVWKRNSVGDYVLAARESKSCVG